MGITYLPWQLLLTEILWCCRTRGSGKKPFRKLKDDKVEGFYYGSPLACGQLVPRNNGGTGLLLADAIFAFRVWRAVGMGYVPPLGYVAMEFTRRLLGSFWNAQSLIGQTP